MECQQLLESLRADRDQYAGEEFTLEQSVEVLQLLEKNWQRTFEESLARTVSHGLSLVFGREYELRIKTKLRGDSPTVEFSLLHDDLETDILDAEGGGVVVLTAFLFRVLLTLSTQPPLAKVMLLDEPFAHLSPEFRPAAAALIRRLVTDAGLQIILITQEPEYIDAADLAYEATQVKGITTFSVVKSGNDVCYDA